VACGPSGEMETTDTPGRDSPFTLKAIYLQIFFLWHIFFFPWPHFLILFYLNRLLDWTEWKL